MYLFLLNVIIYIYIYCEFYNNCNNCVITKKYIFWNKIYSSFTLTKYTNKIYLLIRYNCGEIMKITSKNTGDICIIYNNKIFYA
jgi:hypothetical protein